MIKQYTIDKAYSDNQSVAKHIDGKLSSYEVMSYWEVDGYCNALESEGYTRAYNVEKAEKRLHEAEQELEYAKQAYDIAIHNALVISK